MCKCVYKSMNKCLPKTVCLCVFICVLAFQPHCVFFCPVFFYTLYVQVLLSLSVLLSEGRTQTGHSLRVDPTGK